MSDNVVQEPGSVRINPIDGLSYVWIPPGRFMMGCSPGDDECLDAEKPAHEVTISKGFWMGQTPVTLRAWKKHMEATGSLEATGRPLEVWSKPSLEHPVESAHWVEAEAYCSWARLRLPTEAEWEYAARAGSTASLYGDLDEIAWHVDNSGQQPLDRNRRFEPGYMNWMRENNGNGTHPVGEKKPNAWNLYDMLGNVLEWTSDWFDEKYYSKSEQVDPAGPQTVTPIHFGEQWVGNYRSVRGAAWSTHPDAVRVSFRSYFGPPGAVGFRGVMI